MATAHGAAVFKGKVVRNEVNGAPIAGASVRAGGANPEVSRSPHGDFQLLFKEKKPGDRVTLSVTMTGMKVVNWVQLDVTLPAEPDASELTLILAREAEREEMARRFFRLRSLEAVEANYKRLIEEGKIDRARLQRERDEARAAAGRAAEDLAKVLPGQASGFYKDAMRLFVEGKVDGALQVLDEGKLRRSSQEGRERKEQAEKQLAEATRGWLLRGKLLTTKFRFAEAEQAYAAAVETAPGDYHTCFELAYFLQNLNRHQGATKGYLRCLAIARAQTIPSHVATMLNNLGALYRAQNRMEEAQKAYEEALDTYRKLARANPDTYLPFVAGTLNNLGVQHRDQNRTEEARKAYEEALDIYRQLERANSDTYLPFVAATLNNLGILHGTENRIQEAQKAYDEALGVCRRLARDNPDIHTPCVGTTLHNLGNLYFRQNSMEEARKAYEEALGIRRQLARDNPDSYLQDEAKTLTALGNLFFYQNRMEEARTAREEALAIYRKLAHNDPDAYRPNVAYLRWEMGRMHAANREYAEARQGFEEALEIFQASATRYPARDRPFVEDVKADLAKLPQ